MFPFYIGPCLGRFAVVLALLASGGWGCGPLGADRSDSGATGDGGPHGTPGRNADGQSRAGGTGGLDNPGKHIADAEVVAADASVREDASMQAGVMEIPDDVTYHSYVRGLLEANCLSCHGREGWATSPLLDTWAAVEVHAPLIASAVAEGIMPPWPPDADCRPLVQERLLTPGAIAAVADWFARGAPEGDPADYITAPPTGPVVALGPPTFTVTTGVDYRLPPGLDESTVCFPLDIDLAQGLQIRATHIRPQVDEMLHHAVVWAVDAALAKPSAADGWKCDFSGRLLSGRLPGSVPIAYPQGLINEVRPDERMILEVHYDRSTLPSGEAPSDRTRLDIWTLGAGPPATAHIDYSSVGVSDIFIAAGEPMVTVVEVQQFSEQVEVVGVIPHMHYLGERIDTQIIRADGSEECLVSVPRWDFEWQQLYFLREDEPVMLHPGDAVRVTCVYDNSAGNQAPVNGVILEPKDVVQGWGSHDEMCQTTLVTRVPPP